MGIIYDGLTGEINVDTLILTDKSGSGDITVSPPASGTWITTGVRTDYEAITTTKVLTRDESGKVISNDGAVALVTASLPNVTVAGIQFHFVRVASFDLRVDPPSSSALIYSGGTMADGEYLALASDGAKISVISNGDGDYVVTNEFGTLTEETP